MFSLRDGAKKLPAKHAKQTKSKSRLPCELSHPFSRHFAFFAGNFLNDGKACFHQGAGRRNSPRNTRNTSPRPSKSIAPIRGTPKIRSPF